MSQPLAKHATLKANGLEGLGSASSEVKTHSGPELIVVVDITAVAGTAPTLDVTIEEFDPASGTYFLIDTFPQASSVSTVRRVVAGPHGPFVRASWTVGGSATPSVTFSVGLMSG